MSDDGSLLFAANAGNGAVSVFHVAGAHLALIDRVPSGGSEPNAIAQHGQLLYVLNTAGSSSVVGFRLVNGKLARMPGSQRLLSGNFTNSASVAFSPNGRFLDVTERAGNSIDVFHVQPDGSLSAIKPIGHTVVGLNPAGSANLDITVSDDGRFLYPLNAGTGSIGMFAVENDGSLVNLGRAGGLPATAGLNGIAAN